MKRGGSGGGAPSRKQEGVAVGGSLRWLWGLVLRRKGFLLIGLAVYLIVTATLGTVRMDEVRGPMKKVLYGVSNSVFRSPEAGAVYRSELVYQRLSPHILAVADSNRTNMLMRAWHHTGQKWKPCAKRKLSQAELPPSNGYFIIEANGGLNQQRLSICDAVAVAAMLNATLVIPTFHFNSVWRDTSKFREIFDEDYFIDKLKNHVRVVKELPQDVLARFDNNVSNIINMRAKAKSPTSYYLQKVLPKLLELGAVRIAPFYNRLAYSVPSAFMGLRCLANYEALRFTEPIRVLGDKIVERMMKKSSNSGGKYVSIHLRFEEDIVAYTYCTYDSGKEVKREMDYVRERSWRGKFKRPGRDDSPEGNRQKGKCPLTPVEVAMMLRGMGFDSSTPIYVASGKLYNEEKHMAPLRKMFPLLETKETLASEEELAPFKGHSSRLAAIDYTVCTQSEVFVTTQGGNFPHFMIGHRRFLYNGHAKTINPEKKRLVLSFDNPKISWDKFERNMRDAYRHSDSRGVALRRSDQCVYTYPMPDCMCQVAES